MALILDTGPLLAALDANDPDHRACAELLTTTHEDLIVPVLVLAELDDWCARRLTQDAWLTFLDDVLLGAYHVESPTPADLSRAREIQSTYRELAIGIVDATVIALAERFGEPKVATLDHRHFTTVRPAHITALTLLP